MILLVITIGVMAAFAALGVGAFAHIMTNGNRTIVVFSTVLSMLLWTVIATYVTVFIARMMT